ncbi:MAG: Lrp/AsnC family transcriptional regulator [Alphaproteobacteria bacterium]|nr:Lrp/AsnC family transcriptional regulator [Alphaproteobacteria bacterium]
MPKELTDSLDNCLLETWQRDLPLVARPYRVMAQAGGVKEADVIDRLKAMQASGVIARVGAVVRPNTIGASTLAAVSVPDLQVEETAALMASEAGINHVYLRENDWNLWFVATGPNRAAVDAALGRIASQTRRRVLDLRLERPYHIDLGFKLFESDTKRHVDPGVPSAFADFELREDDARLVQQLMNGLALIPRPFHDLAKSLGRDAEEVLYRIGDLVAAGILPRLGLIVRHRALGWRCNAMVVWDVPETEVDAVGTELAKAAGVNLCYRRRRYDGEWPFNLYCMIHAKSREAAFDALSRASAAAGLDGLPRQILFSLRCFKQTGALVATPYRQEAA